MGWRAQRIAATLLLLAAHSAGASDLTVLNSSGFSAVYKALAPLFEQRRGDHLTMVAASSFGTAPSAIPMRLERGEPADVVIMIKEGLDPLIAQGRILPGSAVELVRSRIGMAVRTGASLPDISSVDSFKQALLNAKSVAYSDSASGVYIAGELYDRLGIRDRMAGKSRAISGEPIGQVIARGEAEIGFQQMSELLPVTGIAIAGFIPEALQKVTVFSAAIPAASKQQGEARALIDYLASPEAVAAIRAGGLDPAAR